VVGPVAVADGTGAVGVAPGLAGELAFADPLADGEVLADGLVDDEASGLMNAVVPALVELLDGVGVLPADGFGVEDVPVDGELLGVAVPLGAAVPLGLADGVVTGGV
jgi:hypothetical protein